MKDVVESLAVERSESGAELAHIHVTKEANGFALWYQPVSYRPRLIAWHMLSPERSPQGVLAAASSHAHHLAVAARTHGQSSAALRRFEQC